MYPLVHGSLLPIFDFKIILVVSPTSMWPCPTSSAIALYVSLVWHCCIALCRWRSIRCHSYFASLSTRHIFIAFIVVTKCRLPFLAAITLSLCLRRRFIVTVGISPLLYCNSFVSSPSSLFICLHSIIIVYSSLYLRQQLTVTISRPHFFISDSLTLRFRHPVFIFLSLLQFFITVRSSSCFRCSLMVITSSTPILYKCFFIAVSWPAFHFCQSRIRSFESQWIPICLPFLPRSSFAFASASWAPQPNRQNFISNSSSSLLRCPYFQALCLLPYICVRLFFSVSLGVYLLMFCCHHLSSPFLVTISCRNSLSRFLVAILMIISRLHISSPFIILNLRRHLLSPFIVTTYRRLYLHFFSSPFFVAISIAISRLHFVSSFLLAIYRRRFSSPILLATSCLHVWMTLLVPISRRHISLPHIDAISHPLFSSPFIVSTCCHRFWSQFHVGHSCCLYCCPFSSLFLLASSPYHFQCLFLVTISAHHFYSEFAITSSRPHSLSPFLVAISQHQS